VKYRFYWNINSTGESIPLEDRFYIVYRFIKCHFKYKLKEQKRKEERTENINWCVEKDVVAMQGSGNK